MSQVPLLDYEIFSSRTMKIETSGTLQMTQHVSWWKTEAAKKWWTIRLFPVTSFPDSFYSATSRLASNLNLYLHYYGSGQVDHRDNSSALEALGHGCLRYYL